MHVGNSTKAATKKKETLEEIELEIEAKMMINEQTMIY